MAQEKPSRAFDSHGFRRISIAIGEPAPNDTIEPEPVSLTEGERLMLADGLRDLGYSAKQITLILSGPDRSSVEQVTGKRIAARSLPRESTAITQRPPTKAPMEEPMSGRDDSIRPKEQQSSRPQSSEAEGFLDDMVDPEERDYSRGYIEGSFSRLAVSEYPVAGKPDPARLTIYNKGYDDGASAKVPQYKNVLTTKAYAAVTTGDKKSRPAKPPDSGGSPTTPGPPTYPARAATNAIGIEQGDIVHAVWASLHGEPYQLAHIASDFGKLTGPLQAYVAAAVEDGREYQGSLNAWMAAFNRQQAKLAKQRKAAQDSEEGVITGIGGAVATAANAIPVVGQAIAIGIAAAIAIREAILSGNPLPTREAEDQVHDGVEGMHIFFGLGRPWSDSEDRPVDHAGPTTYEELKSWVLQDPVAILLPVPRPRTTYHFAPTLATFQKFAHALGLYPGEPNTLFPPSAGGVS